jgi:hypothetical protein
MLTAKRVHIFLIVAACLLLITTSPIWAKSNAGFNLNLTPDQINALEGVVNDLGKKQLKITGNIQRALLELKLEIQRADRFASDAEAAESARRANKLVRKLATLHGDMLKVELAYVLKAKDVLTREQRVELIQGLDFDMEPPQGWMQSQDIEVLVVDLGLSEEQLNKIMGYRAQMQKKAAKIAQKMEAQLQKLETELKKDSPDDRKVNQAVLGLTEQGIAQLNNQIDHRLKAKDVLTVAQKKQLLHALFIASGF